MLAASLLTGPAWLRAVAAPLTVFVGLLCLAAVARYNASDQPQRRARHALLRGAIENGQAPAQMVLDSEEVPTSDGGLRPRAGWNASRQQESDYPKVYILPISQQFTCKADDAHNIANSIYAAEFRIPEALAASSHVTTDPGEADFFYVPAQLYCATVTLMQSDPGELRSLGLPVNHRTLARALLKHIQLDFDFFEQARAIYTFPFDHGFCGFATGEGTVPELAESIILSHWGLTAPEVTCDWWTRLHNFGTCPHRLLPHQLEATLRPPCFSPDKDVVVAHAALDNLDFLDPASLGIPGLESRVVRQQQSTVPGGLVTMAQPFVVAEKPDLRFSFPLLLWSGRLASYPGGQEDKAQAEELLAELQEAARQLPPAEYEGVLANTSVAWRDAFGSELNQTLQALPGSIAIRRSKEHTLFFQGAVRWDDPSYSKGVRHAAVKQLSDAPGFVMRDTTESGQLPLTQVLQEMGRSHFCLAATGAGWGVRLKQSLVAGCVPVVIADGVQMESEDVLPYKDFAVRVPQHALYTLPTLLDSLLQEDGLVDAMSQRGACAWRYLSWHPQHGRALQALMCSLRRRLWGRENVRPSTDWERCELKCPVTGAPVTYR